MLTSAPDAWADAGSYAAGSNAWNGLRDFVAIARDAGIPIRAASHIDLAALKPTDGLLLISPVEAPPRPDLAAFMSDGGRLAVADDFGAAGAFLHGFGISRDAAFAVAPERRLRENPNLPLAKASVRHPLSEGVVALVTNHPQTLHHATLEALFRLDDARAALVLSGAVGSGRLVALGDPSVLINNMLEFSGNRAFAGNLIRYLARDGTLWLATPATRFSGHYGGVIARDPLANLRATLDRMAKVVLTPTALRLTAAAFAALLLFVAASSLPRRASYVRAMLLPDVSVDAGFAGLVRFYARNPRDMRAPLLAYRDELEARLAAWQTRKDTSKRRDEALARGRALLQQLEALTQAEDSTAARTKITPRRLRAVVAAGDGILAELQRSERQDL